MVIEGKIVKTEQVHKKFRQQRAGKSFEKKKIADRKKKGLSEKPERLNVKAFASGRPGHQKFAARKLDRSQNNMRMPVPERGFADEGNEAPETVAVVGPPGSGKTTLIRSLVKHLAHTNLTAVRGPVTCIAGKRRRITFIECPCEVNAMCDVAKVADLVLLTIDASFGFEMETFEFLNICQTHGFPRILGILTHLDKLKTNKQLKKTKKAMRQRFWQDVCAGAKLFYLSGVEKGTYSAKEMINLNRFIAVTKLTLQKWRTTHSCVIADRMEDLTDAGLVQRRPNCDRRVALYGYVRGCPMKQGQRVHIPGVGDFTVAELNHLSDPCGLPTTGVKKKTRHLSEKDRRIYAPMADIGELLYDADAVYFKVDKEQEGAVEELGEGADMMKSLLTAQEQRGTVDARLKQGSVSLFRGGAAVGPGGGDADEDEDDEDDDDDDDEGEEERRPREVLARDDAGRVRRRAVFVEVPPEEGAEQGGGGDDDDDEDEDDDDAGGGVVLGADRPERVRHNISEADLGGLGEDDDEEENGFLFRVQGASVDPLTEDRTRDVRNLVDSDWELEAVREGIRDLFVTGNWTPEESLGAEAAAAAATGAPGPKKKKRAAKADPYGERGYESVDEDDAMDGIEGCPAEEEEDEEDEEDEESEPAPAGRKRPRGGAAAAAAPAASIGDLRSAVRALVPESLRGPAPGARGSGAAPAAAAAAPGAAPAAGAAPDDSGDEEEGEERSEAEGADGDSDEAYRRKKVAQKKAFDASYDAGDKEGPRDYLDEIKQNMEAQRQKTRRAVLEAAGGSVAERVKLIGHFAGLYVRVVVEGVPCEFIRNFNPTQPLILGGLLPQEDRLGIVYCRLKKHRWFPRLIKSGDPLTMSIGWRRFQTQPILAIEDRNGRNRYLKYTPLHMHCVAAFYGPVTPPNTGIIAFTNAALKREVSHFRPSATGYTIEVDQSSRIVKKLKLTGVPARVVRNTAFIKNMFNSALEVSKFEGAQIQTVSGIRGTVKKALNGKAGIFRAGFEDKISRSDIVFLKTWKQIEPYRYYNPVTNLLAREWQPMKSVAELRRERNLAVPWSVDSAYREVRRPERGPNAELKMPRTLEGALPFHKKRLREPEHRDGVSKLEAAVRGEGHRIMEPKELKRQHLEQQLLRLDQDRKNRDRKFGRVKQKKFIQKRKEADARSKERLKTLKKTLSRRADLKSGGKRQR